MFSAQAGHLYIHVPYCAKKCPYCDFNSIAGRDDEQADYVQALLQEFKYYQGRSYNTVFIGGGTPTYLKPEHLETLLDGIRAGIRLDDDYEWTCEANPGSTDTGQLQLLKDHGVNRISIGIQSSHAHHLEFLGRIHTASEARSALSAACSLFPAVSCDFIFGLPNQTADELCDDLSIYKEFELQHASVYHLTIEPGTEFHALHQRGLLDEIDQEQSWQMLNLVAETLADYGLTPYETSNFATADNACRHNLAYWMQRDYDAIGAGAVSTNKGLRQTRHKHPQQYINAINNDKNAIWKSEQLSLQDCISEAWMLGLRLIQGVNIKRLHQLGDDAARWQPIADDFIAKGLLYCENDYLCLSKTGRPLQDYITAQLMPG